MNKNIYYMGIDIGGTKTCIKVYNQQGNCIYEKILKKTANYYLFKNKNEFIDYIHDIKSLAFKEIKFEFISACIAGLSNKSQQKIAIEMFEKKYPNDANKIYMFHDSIAPAYAAFPQLYENVNFQCIVLICGTGSFCLLFKNKKAILNCGGNGFILGDKGSGIDLIFSVFKILLLYFEYCQSIKLIKEIKNNKTESIVEILETIKNRLVQKTGFTIDEIENLNKIINIIENISQKEDIFNIVYSENNIQKLSKFPPLVIYILILVN